MLKDSDIVLNMNLSIENTFGVFNHTSKSQKLLSIVCPTTTR